MRRIWRVRSAVLMAVASAIGSWEKSNESVRFRHWLRRVARNAIVNALSRRPHDRATGGSSVHELLLELPHGRCGIRKHADRIGISARTLPAEAAKIVRVTMLIRETWRAFEMTVIEQRSIRRKRLKPSSISRSARSTRLAVASCEDCAKPCENWRESES